MDKKNAIYGLIFSIVFLVGVVAIVSYGFIAGRAQSNGVSNVGGDILEPSELITISGDTDFSLNITLEDLSILDASNEGENYIEDTKTITITVNDDTSIYSNGVQCDYSIYYEPITVYNASSESIAQGLIELGFIGSSGSNSFELKSISGVTSKTLLYSGVANSSPLIDETQELSNTIKPGMGSGILGESSSENSVSRGIINPGGLHSLNSVSWNLSYRFYNLDIDQSDALGQYPSGKIVIEAGECRSIPFEK